MDTMKILIDPGHGIFTPGKRSPDGEFREGIYNREIARRVVADLQDRGRDAELLVSEDDDISLQERVRRVNAQCLLRGKQNVILISIHVNAAASDGKWHNATGWSVYTSKGKTAADDLATCLANAAAKALEGHRIRADWSDGDIDFEEGFYVLRKTLCPAALTENLFMDNLQNRDYLISQAGKKAITQLHVEGICDYLDSIGK